MRRTQSRQKSRPQSKNAATQASATNATNANAGVVEPARRTAAMGAAAAFAGTHENGAATTPVPDPVPLASGNEPDLADRIRPEITDAGAVALRRMAGTRSIGVTSSTRAEGRTTVACALALAAAQDARTILIELDFDNARLAEVARVATGPGIADLVRGEATIDECLQRVGDDLDVIVAGWVNEPVESILKGLPDIIARVRSHGHDEANGNEHNPTIVVADLPPLDAGITAARVADLFATPVLVVRAGGVATASIQQSAATLGRKPVVILNGTGAKPSRLSKRKAKRRRKAARK